MPREATLNGQKEQAITRRVTLIDNLCTFVHILLPASPPERIQEFVTRVTDKTIDLRNAMSVEQAIYVCLFRYRGDRYQEEFDQVEGGEKPVGKVLFCTFPGLNRLTIGANLKKKFANMVRASVKLEGAFGSRQDQ